MATKIEKYHFEDRCLELSTAPGMTGVKIAQVLTEELKGKDTITQSSVCRWLKSVREERADETREVYREFVKGRLPGDLEQIEEVQEFFLNIHRNLTVDAVKNLVPAGFTRAERGEAGKAVVKIIIDKLKLAGVEPPPDKPGNYMDDDESLRSSGVLLIQARSGIQGVIGRLESSGIAGPTPEEGETLN